jgi:hypothetical protein
MPDLIGARPQATTNSAAAAIPRTIGAFTQTVYRGQSSWEERGFERRFSTPQRAARSESRTLEREERPGPVRQVGRLIENQPALRNPRLQRHSETLAPLSQVVHAVRAAERNLRESSRGDMFRQRLVQHLRSKRRMQLGGSSQIDESPVRAPAHCPLRILSLQRIEIRVFAR